MMERKKLMALDGLAPTSEMFRLAEQDILKKRTEFGPDTYQYEIYIRCQVIDGILKNCILSYKGFENRGCQASI